MNRTAFKVLLKPRRWHDLSYILNFFCIIDYTFNPKSWDVISLQTL